MEARLLLVEDQAMVRRALRDCLEAQEGVTALEEAEDLDSALEAFRRFRPDVVLMDVQLRGPSGIDATRAITTTDPNARVVMISAHDARSLVEGALRAGAMGYVVKSAPLGELFQAIEAVMENRFYLSPAIAHHAVAAVADGGEKKSRGFPDLTSREREVLQGIADGLSSKEIASNLCIGFRTVESHRASLMRKLGVHRASGLVRIAIREGFLSP